MQAFMEVDTSALLRAGMPVRGMAAVVSNSEHNDSVVVRAIHHGERETLEEDPACVPGPGRTRERESDRSEGLFDSAREARAEPVPLFVVTNDLS
jgi:hypothetical protein